MRPEPSSAKLSSKPTCKDTRHERVQRGGKSHGSRTVKRLGRKIVETNWPESESAAKQLGNQ
jgi:hypothetical protein